MRLKNLFMLFLKLEFLVLKPLYEKYHPELLLLRVSGSCHENSHLGKFAGSVGILHVFASSLSDSGCDPHLALL